MGSMASAEGLGGGREVQCRHAPRPGHDLCWCVLKLQRSAKTHVAAPMWPNHSMTGLILVLWMSIGGLVRWGSLAAVLFVSMCVFYPHNWVLVAYLSTA